MLTASCEIASLIKITRWLDADRCHALNQGKCNFPQLVYSPLTHMAISAPNNFHIIWKLLERDKISQKLRKKIFTSMSKKTQWVILVYQWKIRLEKVLSIWSQNSTPTGSRYRLKFDRILSSNSNWYLYHHNIFLAGRSNRFPFLHFLLLLLRSQ